MRIHLGLTRRNTTSAEYQRQRREKLRDMKLCLYCLEPHNRDAYACEQCSRVHYIKEKARL